MATLQAVVWYRRLYYGKKRGPDLAAPGLASPFELPALLPVLCDALGLFDSRVEVGLPLARREAGHCLLCSLRILRDAGALELLDRTGQLGILPLERHLRRPLQEAAEERDLHQPVHDGLQEAAALNAAEQGEDAEQQQQPAQDVEREEVEPDRRGHRRIVACRHSVEPVAAGKHRVRTRVEGIEVRHVPAE